MDKQEKEIVIYKYNKRLKEFGYNPKTLGWDKERHYLRYHILLNHWNLEEQEVLDFGCGFGDMFDYINRAGIKLNYHGVDINENLILTGKKIYPEADLSVRDIFVDGLGKQYDYIFSSGTHNTKLNNNWNFIEKTFELCNKYSKKGFALNFMSNKVDYELEDIYHCDPASIISLAYKYSNRILFRNDYMPFEFTIFIDKQNNFDKSSVVYPEFVKFISKPQFKS